jgi:lipopolysaccharide/colanic/teichoic acid biosynthesis glycosyltransferase
MGRSGFASSATRLPARRPPPQLQPAGVERITVAVARDSWAYAFSKRLLDVVVGSALLVASSPLILLLAIITRLDSSGPALFRQQRVGRGGELFTFYKCRTMYVDAKERWPELYDYRYETSEFEKLHYKHADDPRLTRVGRVLRRTSFDELPNLINVVKGELSLVGPRPELPEYALLYDEQQRAKFGVKPGATGLAVVQGRNMLSVAETIKADLEYVRRRSLRLDIEILWRTVSAIVRRRGAV